MAAWLLMKFGKWVDCRLQKSLLNFRRLGLGYRRYHVTTCGLVEVGAVLIVPSGYHMNIERAQNNKAL